MRFRIATKKEKGFTLVEMMVAITVTSIVLIGILTFLTNTLANNSVRQARADLLREAQLTLDVITRDIGLSSNVDDANRIEDPYSPDAASTNGLGWSSDADTLILATAAEDTENNIIFQDETHYITEKNNMIYYLEDGTLYKRTLAAEVDDNSERTTCPEEAATSSCGADRMLVNNVAELEFRYYNALNDEVDPVQARSVEITLVLRDRKSGRDIEAEYTTRKVFRNE